MRSSVLLIAVLDQSAKILYITELARGMSLLLKVMIEPKVTVRTP